MERAENLEAEMNKVGQSATGGSVEFSIRNVQPGSNSAAAVERFFPPHFIARTGEAVAGLDPGDFSVTRIPNNWNMDLTPAQEALIQVESATVRFPSNEWMDKLRSERLAKASLDLSKGDTVPAITGFRLLFRMHTGVAVYPRNLVRDMVLQQ